MIKIQSLFTKIRHSYWSKYLFLILIGGGLVGLLIYLTSPFRYAFSNDTAGYVQEAQNLMSGKGFVRSSGWNELTQNYRYSALFPPGYPTEIFLLMHLGLDAAYAAKISSWLAWILLLPAVFFAICPIIDQRKAIGVGLLTVLSPALYDSGYVALSDSTSSLFTILSLGFLIRQLN